MTTTVVIKARAWGATVVAKTNDQDAETIELGSHEDRNFHIQPGSKMTLEVSEPAAAPEPAAAEEPLDPPAPDADKADPPAETSTGKAKKFPRDSDDAQS